jgi:hypothetical protein
VVLLRVAAAAAAECCWWQGNDARAPTHATARGPPLALLHRMHTRQSRDQNTSSTPHVKINLDRIVGNFLLVAAGDWFGSQHMGPHSPREAPHVCTV